MAYIESTSVKAFIDYISTI